MVYDNTVYNISVTVGFDGQNLVTTITQNGHAVSDALVQFNNTYNGNVPKYDPPKDPGKTVTVDYVPNTGDTTNPTLWGIVALGALAGAGVTGIVTFRKKKEDKETENE